MAPLFRFRILGRGPPKDSKPKKRRHQTLVRPGIITMMRRNENKFNGCAVSPIKHILFYLFIYSGELTLSSVVLDLVPLLPELLSEHGIRYL